VITDTATDDDVWIPAVTAAGLAIITRDRHIQERTSEKTAVVAANARMFAITSKDQLNNWGLLEVVVSQWRNLERAAEEPGPYIYSLTRTSLEKIKL
jgi:PIN like domain